VTNYSRLSTRMHDFKVGIAYEDDIDQALAILLDLATKDERVLKDPAPAAFVMDLGDNAVILALRYWANSSVWWMTSRDMTKWTKEAFDASGISIPFPQVTYHPADAKEDAAPPPPTMV
jgi:small conductance mechanosensitive channel